MTVALVDTLFVKQQRGPTLNVTIAVSAIEGVDLNDKDTLETDTITIDESVEVFFKFRLITDDKYVSPNSYVCMRKRETVDNAAVGITITCDCNELKTCYYVQCTNTLIEISLGEMSWTSKKSVGKVGKLWVLLYKLEITFTINKFLMNNRLYEDTECTDFQLQTSAGSVAVHKVMLSVHSDMFKTMLKGEWKETAEGRITMDGVSTQTLQHLKDYMYLGILPDEGLEPLILLAEHYLMDKLKSDCITKLVKSEKPENFDRIIKFACQSAISEELMSALICEIPDKVANSIYEFKKNKTVK